MKILYLLPPSEGKNTGGNQGSESLSFTFEKPLDIAVHASEKDLKCTGKRYEQGIELNKNIHNSLLISAIERYSGVMYNAIDYAGMNEQGKQYFENNFGILSGMYGLLKPLDEIGNYKLPIETKGLYKFWGEQITNTINQGKYDYVVDFLPISYGKMIQWNNIQTKILRVNFLHQKDGELKKISHGVKKIKGEYIKNLCERGLTRLEDFHGEKVQISENEYHINIIL